MVGDLLRNFPRLLQEQTCLIGRISLTSLTSSLSPETADIDFRNREDTSNFFLKKELSDHPRST
jgi:hypothetical protein